MTLYDIKVHCKQASGVWMAYPIVGCIPSQVTEVIRLVSKELPDSEIVVEEVRHGGKRRALTAEEIHKVANSKVLSC